MPEAMPAAPYRFEFVGGAPCLDFTNTVGGDRRATPTEHLHGYADLVAWARQGELITAAQARALRSAPERRPARLRRQPPAQVRAHVVLHHTPLTRRVV